VGMEFVVPAPNRASLTLAPNKVAAIARLRGMFRQIGATTSIAVATALMTRDNHAGLTQAHTFIVFAVILVAALPLLLLGPEHRGVARERSADGGPAVGRPTRGGGGCDSR
jgi:hypothetical protein